MKYIKKKVLIIFLLALNANSQSTVESIFLKLPIYNLSFKKDLLKHRTVYKRYTEKEVLTFYNPKDSETKSYTTYSINELLPKNGYMKVSYTANHGDSGDTYEICYWNLKNERKFVALISFSVGTATYEEIEFFEYHGGQIKKLEKSSIIPEIKLENILEPNNLNASEFNSLKKIFKEHQIFDYKLPIHGKDLILSPEIDGSELNDKENELRSKIIQKLWKTKIRLEWNEGSFILKTVYNTV